MRIIVGTIEEIKKFIKGKGVVKNLSSHTIYVVENDTKNKPVARKLGPKRKTPKTIDADGFKRADGKPIKGHSHWWKLRGWTTIILFDDGEDIKFGDTYGKKFLSKVPEDEFGNVTYDHVKNWGIPIKNITDTKKDKNGTLSEFYVESIGWISKIEAINMIKNELIDNAIVVEPNGNEPYIRSKPDGIKSNNFIFMARK
jgi:hypothetical protein